MVAIEAATSNGDKWCPGCLQPIQVTDTAEAGCVNSKWRHSFSLLWTLRVPKTYATR